MSKFLSPRFEKLKAYVPGEQPQDQKYIKLNTNESPYPPSAHTQNAINTALLDRLGLYGDPKCTALKDSLAKFHGVERENVFVGNGSDDVLNFIFMAFCDGKTAVSYPEISYGFYPVYADLHGIEKNEIPLSENLLIKAEDYMAVGTSLVIANPNAPTGECLSVADIEKIAKANPENVVVIDEAYINFGGETSIPLTKKYNNLIVVQTFSKSHSLAGARLGFAVGNSELIADLEKLRYSTNPYNVNRLTTAVGIAAIEDNEYYKNNSNKIVKTRENTAKKLKTMGFELTDSTANFLFARHEKLNGTELYDGLRQRGFLVRHFNKPRIDAYIRITIGTEEQMALLCNALKEMLKNA